MSPNKQPNFFAIRFSKEKDIQDLIHYYENRDTSSIFSINGLTHHKQKITIDGVVFIVASGWKSSMSFPYTQGMYGIAKIVKMPYNISGKNYTIDVKFFYFFDKVLGKRDFLYYPETADIPYIGPSTIGTKTQAISILSIEEAQLIMDTARQILNIPIPILKSYFPWCCSYQYSASKKPFFKMIDTHDPKLNITKIAEVFSNFILNYQSSDTSTILGIFGKWGRGKTFFYKEIKHAIQQKPISQKYTFCTFQPWKYQEKESAWAYLYQTLLQSYLQKDLEWWCGKCPYLKLAVLNLKKLGWGKFMVIIMFLLYIGYLLYSIPNTDNLNFKTTSLLKLFGIPGVVFYVLYKFINKHRDIALNTIQKYTKNHYFMKKLGFQREIEEELKILLKTFIDADKNEKLILFVDDLDRCNEKLIIDIIDSLRIMLDDNEIRKRIIILTAIDERILLKAIKHKYSFSANVSGGQANQNTVLSTSEYIEKFFLMGIKLSSLDNHDITQLVDSYIYKINQKNSYDKTKNEERSNGIISTDSQEYNQINNTSQQEIQESPSKTISKKEITKDNTHLLEEEKKYIIEHIKKISDITPRKINMFIHRYLLFKALLIELIGKRSMESIDSRLYADLIFLIIYDESSFRSISSKIKNLSNKQECSLILENNEYKLPTGVLRELIKITEMVSPF